ncbi:MAG: rhomboid family intramembrane serine protease [Pseudomonadota bacterium]|nr:rhomboid family intramembrane serine protease [Pseudomonadota bacterium]
MNEHLYAAMQLPSDLDLQGFSEFLKARNIQHRITLVGVEQVIWVGSHIEQAQLVSFFQQWQHDNRSSGQRPSEQSTLISAIGRLRVNAARFPLTIGLLLANLVAFPLGLAASNGEHGELFQNMMLVAFEIRGDRIYFADLAYTLDSGQYWRLLSPMLIHFGWLHLTFNLLWVWEIGRRIEFLHGASMFILLTLFSGLLANLAQYWLTGVSLFGGMSGVLFGFIGYCMVWDAFSTGRRFGIARSIYIGMLVFLIIGFTGAFDSLGLGNLANGAHVGGLIAGVVTAAAAMLLKLKFNRS